MLVNLKSIRLTSFKGVKDKEYNFSNITNIFGQNGIGKTTIATAHYWLWSDKDYDLHSNPNIRPIDVEECLPRVEETLEIDGKIVTIAKQQKRTVGKPNTDGVSKVTLTNSYEINAVPKTERDFKAYLSDLNIDFDLFLPLSHSDVFTSQKSTDMRKILFSMANVKSDKQIAQLTDNATGVCALLDDYTMEEIKAMQNATLRKIKEDYGKDGEILRAKIDGLETAKVDIDVAELKLGKKAIMELINSNKAKQEDISKQYEEYQKLSDGVLQLQFKMNDLSRKANEENNRKRREIEDKIADKKFLLKQTNATISETDRSIELTEQTIGKFRQSLEKLREEYKTAQNLEFDENSLVCSYCSQEYPIDRKEQIKAEFHDKKAKNLADITKRGNETKATIEKLKKDNEVLQNDLQEHKKSLEMLNTAIAELEKQLSELPTSIDISENKEYKGLSKQIEEKEQAMSKSNSADELKTELNSELNELQNKLTEIERRIAMSENNIRIDEQIEELLKKQSEYEQSKADAENILYQLDLVSKKKNELLTEDINKHFELVKWQMFEYQKNGEYKECCVPLIDRKRFGESTNTGREVLAKLDIIKGLQKFYGQYYPVFLDGAECLDSNTKSRITMDCQMIYLSVSDSDKELRID